MVSLYRYGYDVGLTTISGVDNGRIILSRAFRSEDAFRQFLCVHFDMCVDCWIYVTTVTEESNFIWQKQLHASLYATVLLDSFHKGLDDTGIN